MKTPELDSYWNYRVIRRVYKGLDGTTEDQFGVYEVYYRDGKPVMCSVEADRVYSDSVEWLKKSLENRLLALKKPILNYTDFEYNENEEGN